MQKVYVLNNSYECISCCSLNRALSLIGQKKAEVIKYADFVVRTVSKAIRVPLIIKIYRFIGAYARKFKFSNKMTWERDNFTCQYCGKHIDEKKNLTTDHIIPRSRGGKTIYENMVTACFHCNRKKSNRTPIEANMFPLKKPIKPSITKRTREIMEEVKKILVNNV